MRVNDNQGTVEIVFTNNGNKVHDTQLFQFHAVGGSDAQDLEKRINELLGRVALLNDAGANWAVTYVDMIGTGDGAGLIAQLYLAQQKPQGSTPGFDATGGEEPTTEFPIKALVYQAGSIGELRIAAAEARVRLSRIFPIKSNEEYLYLQEMDAGTAKGIGRTGLLLVTKLVPE